MKKHLHFKKFLLLTGTVCLLSMVNSCSDDDDGEIANLKPTGAIQVDDDQVLSGNRLTVQLVTAAQYSWLVALEDGDEDTHNFIAQPVGIEKGTHSNLSLVFDAGAISESEGGHEVVLKLYADNQTSGTQGQWDPSDPPILNVNNEMVIKRITVFKENYSTVFESFDTNGDGSLDAEEVPSTHNNNFTEWDADADGSLSLNEFYNTIFANTDRDDDGGVSKEEWDAGFYSMFGNWSENDFATFDTNTDGMLNTAEWNSIFGESDWFQSYDSNSNNLITEDEWNSGLFKDWDINNDDLINQAEFTQYWPYVKNWYPDSDSYTFGWYDINKNGTLEFQEALETYNYTFYFRDRWDEDQDGSLNLNEFYHSFFLNTDYTLDNGISQEEWDGGFTALFSKWVDDEFSTFDENQNELLSNNEWMEIFEESGWFEAYDTNGDDLVSQSEWENGLFADWDTNVNEVIEEEEFDNYISYVWTWMRW